MSNNEQHWIVRIIKNLAFSSDEYAVFGSSLLDVLGLKQTLDVDIIATRHLFDVLKRREGWKKHVFPDGKVGLTHKDYDIELFYTSSIPLCDRGGVERMVRNATVIDGVRFVNLEDTLAWKRAFGREKDLRDVALIETYMKGRKS